MKRKKPSTRTKGSKTKKPNASRSSLEGARKPLLEALDPTLRAYGEEQFHILSLARQHPKLGDRFLREYERQATTRVAKKDRPAFLEAMARVNVEARATHVIGQMHTYWGFKLDEETKANVREDVRSMYAGE